MNDKNIAQETYSQWTKPILVSVFIIGLMGVLLFYKMKDTRAFNAFMTTYTEYFNIQYNTFISGFYSILYYYIQGGNEQLTIDALVLRKTEQGLLIVVTKQTKGTALLLQSISKMEKEQKGNEILIKSDNLSKLDDIIEFKRDRNILEKIINLSLINRKDIQFIDMKNIKEHNLRQQMKDARGSQNFIERFFFGDKAALGEAELKKIESRKNINNNYENEVLDTLENTIKDTNDTVIYEEKLKEIEQNKIIEKQKEEQRIKDEEEAKNTKKRENYYGDSQYGKEIKATKQEIETKEQPSNFNLKDKFEGME